MALRVAVLASGSGTILDATLTDGVPVELVVVDRPCAATEVAERHGVRWELVERTSFGADFDRDAYTARIVDVLQKHDIDLVVMAGFGTILGKPMFDAFPGRILNTHPALLPAFKGWHAVDDALGLRGEGHRLHRARRHRGGRRRADPGPGGRAGPARRHRRDAARAHQGGRAPALHPATIREILERRPAVRSMRALLSVYDKTGVVELAARPARARAGSWCRAGAPPRRIAEAGLPVTDVAELTGFPADPRPPGRDAAPQGARRHPRRPDRPEHLADMADLRHRGHRPRGRQPLPVLAPTPSIELIDIGGPAMVRAAAKNHAHVGVVTDPADYDGVLDELRADGALSPATRRRLARAAFATTAAYDAAIVAGSTTAAESSTERCRGDRPRHRRAARHLALTLDAPQVLRYGENPHQRAPATRRAGRAELVGRRDPARRQGAVVPQPLRRRRRVAAGPRSLGDRPAARRHQARQPVRRGGGRRHRRRLHRGLRVRHRLGLRRHRGGQPAGRRAMAEAHGRRCSPRS